MVIEDAGPGAGAARATFSRGYALVIGVGADLPATVNDANALAALLRDPARAAYPGDQVVLLVEKAASRDGILNAFEALRARTATDPESTVVVFFSGHGARIGPPTQAGRHYLLAHGYDVARPDETCVSDAELSAAITALAPKRLLLLLDCCHAAALLVPKGAPVEIEPALPRAAVLEELGKGAGRVILTSCRREEQSFATAKHSLFTACLLDALSGKAPAHLGFARVLEVVTHVRREVTLRSPDQHPFLNSIEDLTESFAVCRVPDAPAATPALPLVAPKGPGGPVKGLPEWKRPGHRAKIAALVPAYEKALLKLQKLRVAHTVTADATLKFQYEHDIEDLEKAVQKSEAALEKLHAELGEG